MKSKISIIAAVDNNFAIGKANALPWGRIPADMKHFREITEGHTVVMGRKTFESIGKPLPKRRNIVLTRDQDFKAMGCEVMYSINDILKLASSEEICIIGGGAVYKEFLPYVDTLLITFIDGAFDGDTYFPLRDFSGWRKIREDIVEPNGQTPYRLRFTTFIREAA